MVDLETRLPICVLGGLYASGVPNLLRTRALQVTVEKRWQFCTIAKNSGGSLSRPRPAVAAAAHDLRFIRRPLQARLNPPAEAAARREAHLDSPERSHPGPDYCPPRSKMRARPRSASPPQVPCPCLANE